LCLFFKMLILLDNVVLHGTEVTIYTSALKFGNSGFFPHGFEWLLEKITLLNITN